MSAPAFNDVRADYFTRFGQCIPAPGRGQEMEAVLGLILRNQARYEAVANKLAAPPWYVIALIHYREADLNFRTHLFNGDPLTARTVNEPKGQPATGQPPFTWEASAWAALRYDRMDKLVYSDVAQIAYALEGYNGWGYHARKVVSPYLWAGSSQYTAGKFVADGQYSSTFTDRQLGAMTLLRYGVNAGHFVLRGQQILPAGALPVTATSTMPAPGSILAPE